ncbi:hypothetical protein ABFV57_10200 [Pseudomonas neuropathica]|uniref:hypothetical protein n=1 Tax=Pseudomonas TaxID=286 RepID=UPI00300F07A4
MENLFQTLIGYWPMVAAGLLIVLKQFYKLYVNHKPDKVDYIKALAALPLDVSFMVVGLCFKVALTPSVNNSVLNGLFIWYLFVGPITTLLWRVCDNRIKKDAIDNFALPFSANVTVSSVGLLAAIKYVS